MWRSLSQLRTRKKTSKSPSPHSLTVSCEFYNLMKEVKYSKYQAQMGGRWWDNVWHRWRSNNCSEYHWGGFGVSVMMMFNIWFPYSYQYHQNHHSYENSSSYSIFDIKCTTNICTKYCKGESWAMIWEKGTRSSTILSWKRLMGRQMR